MVSEGQAGNVAAEDGVWKDTPLSDTAQDVAKEEWKRICNGDGSVHSAYEAINAERERAKSGTEPEAEEECDERAKSGTKSETEEVDSNFVVMPSFPDTYRDAIEQAVADNGYDEMADHVEAVYEAYLDTEGYL